MRRARLVVAVLAAFVAVACGQMNGCSFGYGVEVERQPATPPGDPAAEDLRSLPASQRTVIAFLGDSITAGHGLTMVQAYPALIEQMFKAEGYADVEILNAGISGDTTAGGLRRLEQVLGQNVRVLVVALGANDALRGLAVGQTRENLASIIEQTLANGTEVVLVGMEAPTNYGEDYQRAFRNVFGELAAAYRRRIAYVPFLLEGVAGMPQFNQADGIHPNEQGARIIAEHLYPSVRNVVDLLPVPGSDQ
jgi:acyl-CoA thioesterase-1